MTDLSPDQILRRSALAWLLEFAELCPSYAAKAAREREKIGTDHGCPGLFKGLADHFDAEWSLRKARKESA